MTSSIGKLQCELDKANKLIFDLKNKNAEYQEEIIKLKDRIEYLEATTEEKIEKAVKKAIESYENTVVQKLRDEIKEKDKRIFELEKRLNITSENSNLPSSKDPIWKQNTKVFDERSTKEKENKKNIGGQLNHKKNILEPLKEEDITEIVEHKINKCQICGCEELDEISNEYHDVTDFIIIPKNTRHIFKTCKCSKCGTINKEQVPTELWAPNQYGEGVKTLALVLNVFGDVSLKRTRDIIKGLSNEKINPTEGYLAKLSKIAANKLENFLFDVKEKIVKSKLVQHDDGVIQIGKTDENKINEIAKLLKKDPSEVTNKEVEDNLNKLKKLYQGVLRVYSADNFVLFKAHTTKEANTYDEDGILSSLSKDTVLMHDHMVYNYNDKFEFQNAECNIHGIRKGRSIKANTEHIWPDKMASLLEEYNSKKQKIIKQNEGVNLDNLAFDNETLNNLKNKYDKIILDGFIECENFKWKTVYTDEKNLLNFFKNFKDEILKWATNFNVPFTNNLCEGLIRIVKSKMKISYQFKSITTAMYYADIISYTETCYRNGIDRFEAIKRLFSNNPFTVKDIEQLNTQKNNI